MTKNVVCLFRNLSFTNFLHVLKSMAALGKLGTVFFLSASGLLSGF